MPPLFNEARRLDRHSASPTKRTFLGDGSLIITTFIMLVMLSARVNGQLKKESKKTLSGQITPKHYETEMFLILLSGNGFGVIGQFFLKMNWGVWTFCPDFCPDRVAIHP
jgi:hypothetical protein